MKTTYQDILSRARALEQETVRILCDLVRTPSFSSREKDVIQVIRKEMTKAGCDDVRVDTLGSIVGRIGNGKRTIAFDAHIDTVYAGDLSQWTFDPFTPRIEAGKVWGRGTVDQKGGMASMLTAARLIKEMALASDITVLLTGTVMEEDCDGLCWQHLIDEDHVKPDLVVITEPTNMNVYRGHRGRMEIRVEVKGVSCHGSAPERGVNAVYKASRIALAIETLNERLRHDPFLGKGSITVTEVVSSSPSLCAVPDAARLHLDRRLTSGETMESAIDEVRKAAQLAGIPDAVVSVLTYEEAAYTGKVYPTLKYYPTWTLHEGSPHLQAAVDTYQRLFGKQPLVDKWTFSTNGVAIAGKHGIPCLGLGPGNEVYAHAANEATPIEHLTAAAAFYAGLVGRFAGRVEEENRI
jgi:putative selenium metabolism hydrolase